VGSAASAKRAAPQASIKMAIVTDIGGLNDKGFNQSANAGRLEAQRKLKIPTKVYVTQTANDRLPNLLLAARQGYNLVFGIGFFMGSPLNSVAPQFPNTKFAGVDVNYTTDLPGKPKNVRGLQFREQEAGYLVGYIAGLVAKYQKGPQVVSGIGANPVPAIVRYLAGYRAGAKRANPKVTVINSYADHLHGRRRLRPRWAERRERCRQVGHRRRCQPELPASEDDADQRAEGSSGGRLPEHGAVQEEPEQVQGRVQRELHAQERRRRSCSDQQARAASRHDHQEAEPDQEADHRGQDQGPREVVK
jgi:PnrA-like ABC transporter substrate-binding protein